MSDRLNELRQQRALLQQQADWLDREIAACLAVKPPAAPEPSASPAAKPQVEARPKQESLSIEGQPELIYTPDPAGTSQQVKRGCFLYFFAILALLGAALATLYFVHYRDRPMLIMEKDGPAPGHAESATPADSVPSDK